MKYLLYSFFLFFLFSCTLNKVSTNKFGNGSRKVEVNYSMDGNSGSLIGFYSNSESYVLLNLFGPLGRNLIKLYIESDTICLIDLVNNKRINYFSKNVLIFCKDFFSQNSNFSDSLFVCDFIRLLKIDSFSSNQVLSASALSFYRLKCLEDIILSKNSKNSKLDILVRFGKFENANFIEFHFSNKKLDKVESFNKLKYSNFEGINLNYDDSN